MALPHSPDNVVPMEQAAGTPVQMVFIGTCTGGRVRDFHEALAVLERGGGRVAPGVQLVVTPASREVAERLRADGTLAKFEAMGAIVTTPGCGACCGTSGVIPGDGMNVLSTANRNFKARMGNATASIYLASPAACAAAAATGRITDPRTVTPDRMTIARGARPPARRRHQHRLHHRVDAQARHARRAVLKQYLLETVDPARSPRRCAPAT